ERYIIRGISEGLTPVKKRTVEAVSDNGEVKKFNVITRLDTKIEVEYYKHGGILQYVLRRIMSG
ncbi:MAG: hypothetical protein QW823_02920, partial [Candidatus Caldarchaeum sp.]